MEIDVYVGIGEWVGKVGGYVIQGCVEVFVCVLLGSYLGVVGFLFYEMCGLLLVSGVVFG